MALIILLVLLVVTLLILVSLLKDRKEGKAIKEKVKEIMAYSAEHIQALELEGISVSDDLEVQQTKAKKIKKKLVVKSVVFAILLVLLIIIL